MNYKLGEQYLFNSVPNCVEEAKKAIAEGYGVSYFAYCNDHYYGFVIIREPKPKENRNVTEG